MAQPPPPPPLWLGFLAFMYTLVITPMLMLFRGLFRYKEDTVPNEPIATTPVPGSATRLGLMTWERRCRTGATRHPLRFGWQRRTGTRLKSSESSKSLAESEVGIESNKEPSESSDRSTPLDLSSLSQPEDSSEPEYPAFVTSKTDINPKDRNQASSDPSTTSAPANEAGEAVDKTIATTRWLYNDLKYALQQLDALQRHYEQEIPILRNYVQGILKKLTDKIEGTDETREETCPYVSAVLVPEDDDVDAKKENTKQVTPSASPQEIDATGGGNVSEGPPKDQDTIQADVSAETGQTLDESSCDDLPIGPLRSLVAEERNTAPACFTGTPDNGRPPENHGWERQDNGYIDSGPREMLYLDNHGPLKTQGDCFSADDLSSGPKGLFETEDYPEPPNDHGTLGHPTGFQYQEKEGHTTWDDYGGGIDDEVDSGPKEMLFGMPLSEALMSIRQNYGDDEDDDSDTRYHADVCFGDEQPPQDAWGLERNEDVADRGLVVSAMQHVSKPPGQDIGIAGDDMKGLKLSIEANEDNSRTSFDVPMEPPERPLPDHNYNYNNDAMGRTPDMNCG
ncbi:PREDICTED: uncharacterized protein LOC109474562 [Branchiostoma belcheri]|uniref:Uncharacterized protein LOC109474562 n=1 Tax=Branchiostoma belcheri TaxID=7741 RepID=A0A6P4ZH86_BRABE|nr:PREDICTED: uncharacterized protein LOC109474562 [Branchiostoma belcheri]